MVNIPRVSALWSNTKQKPKRKKSSSSVSRPFGDNYHICLGPLKFSKPGFGVEMDILRESLQVEKFPSARGAEEVLAGNM